MMILVKFLDTPTGRPPPDYSKLWFATPGTCNDFSNLTPLEREIFEQILQLKRQEKMDPINDEADKLEFLKKNFMQHLCPKC